LETFFKSSWLFEFHAIQNIYACFKNIPLNSNGVFKYSIFEFYDIELHKIKGNSKQFLG
jgi:hypothetical protein